PFSCGSSMRTSSSSTTPSKPTSRSGRVLVRLHSTNEMRRLRLRDLGSLIRRPERMWRRCRLRLKLLGMLWKMRRRAGCLRMVAGRMRRWRMVERSPRS
ncbi:hypothetical protein LTR95_016995, partial [Oleoguttula sp. CCFEE 5521]